MICTRGCPWNCTFCDRKNRMGKGWRPRSPGNIVSEMQTLIAEHGIREFMFFDDNLIINRQWVYQLCEEIQRIGTKVQWECRARVDMVDLPLLKTMKAAGCYRIRYGMESGDNHILKVLKKGITVEQTLDCARMTKEAGIEIFSYFMMGAPQETPETMEKTIQLALKVDADFAIFSKTILIIGSELFNWGVENGHIRPDYWERFLRGEESDSAPCISTKDLPSELVNEYVAKAYRKFYQRPKYLLRRLTKIRSLNQFTRQALMARSLFLK